MSEIATELVACDLCGSTDYEELMVGRDMQHGTAGIWPVVRCCECGLVFTNPRPALSDIGKVYPEDYVPYKAKRRKKLTIRWKLQQWALRCHWGYPGGRVGLLGKVLSYPFLLWTKAKARNYDLFRYEGNGKLLDYGCGSGGFLMRMQARGWDVTGMDMSEKTVEICRAQGIEAYAGTAMDEVFGEENFDAVTLWQVLEHVPSPSVTLKQIHKVLKPSGVLVIGVPNIGSWLAERYKEYWFPLELPRHLTHFDKKTIKAILERNGFTVEKIKANRYGSVVQATFRYLARDKGGWWYRFLAGSKRLCRLIDIPMRWMGRPEQIVVHARKRS